MSQSVIDLCNGALQKVGAVSILSLTDNRREARQCSLAYDGARRSELRKHRWNFAIKRAVLAPDATAPAFDFAYQFTLPADCLRILLPADAYLDWVVEGRKILTNDSDTLYLRYIADVEDVTQWDPVFYDLMGVRIASDICESLTNSPAKLGRLMQEYAGLLNEARKMNAFEQLPAEAPDDSWLLVRL